MQNSDQAQKIRTGKGFIAALDQSGGSTPKALAQYGVDPTAWSTEDQMFDLMHQMRSRIASAPAFTGDKVIGAILFEQTTEREIEGRPSAEYLWQARGVVPFLKIDKGLQDASDGVQRLKPIPGLSDTLRTARARGIFGTKARSVIAEANATGIADIVAQQFETGAEVLAHGLVPILEPEVLITSPEKAEAEARLCDALGAALDALPDGAEVMLKVTLPEAPGLYGPLIAHPKVMRVVALSGGYSREEATDRLAQNTGMIASFSRALTEGLSAGQSDDAFNAGLSQTIDAIHAASVT